MKIRSTAMLVASGVLAIASLAYVAPALAENENNSNAMQTMPAPDNNPQNPGTDNQNTGTDNTGSSSTTMNSNNDNNNNANSSSTDQATPDTATGDDDY